ncbi:MAG TPA: ATP-binding protein [Edaphobacter sp.]|uniref:ATP-dependent nuclease n=1 Tax=Edaphobacter sp. TaxID=1934404 RepID=UPI002B7CD59F|nr:ATP-binding protein [Edaphobacter sp.]HUZ97617.1 ATP-binding protein [Edaphobacter sp.]
MGSAAEIRKLTVSRFRGIERLEWRPVSGMNIILGGGDVGKTTILEAIALLLSPTNSTALSESDYWQRDSSQEFFIEAVISLSEASGVNTQRNFSWPWTWNGTEAVQPVAKEEGEDTLDADDPVYRVRVRGTTELELAWELVQPNDEADHFSVSVRRKIGVVRLSTDDHNDRDLRLVYGSGLDRLLADSALRARIGKQISELDVEGSLNSGGRNAIDELDKRLVGSALPHDLKLGLTTSQGLSIGALIGLLAKKHGVSLPLGTWGSGTRRMVALEIASAAEKEVSITLVDEIERGLEPYRLRKLVSVISDEEGQAFITTHSPVAIACSEKAQLWYMDANGNVGALARGKIAAQQRRDPETFLAKVAVIAEGPTEVGFLKFFLEKAFGSAPLDHGVRVCDGQGNYATLDLLETLSASGLIFAGLVDNEGTDPGRWQLLKRKLGDRLHQWQQGCTEQQVIREIAEDKLPELLKDEDGAYDGDRLRTIAERLGVQDKQLASIVRASADQGKTLRELIVAAATGSKEGAPTGDEKAWKKHSQHWFKSEKGGRELAQRLVALGAWGAISPQLGPLLSAILVAAGLPPKDKLTL